MERSKGCVGRAKENPGIGIYQSERQLQGGMLETEEGKRVYQVEKQGGKGEAAD